METDNSSEKNKMLRAINTSTNKENSFQERFDLEDFSLFKMEVYGEAEKGAKTIKNTFSLPNRGNKNF